MSAAVTRARILRVNHAGEYGAIRIYSAQIVIARRLCPDLLPFLFETREHERAHLASFRALMREDRHVCRLLSVWSVGGTALGLLTALAGREGDLICTEAVERTVHRHHLDQMRWAARRDPELWRTIEQIRREELQHLDFAVSGRRRHSLAHTLFDLCIVGVTETLIFASTRGESLKLGRTLAGEPSQTAAVQRKRAGPFGPALV